MHALEFCYNMGITGNCEYDIIVFLWKKNIFNAKWIPNLYKHLKFGRNTRKSYCNYRFCFFIELFTDVGKKGKGKNGTGKKGNGKNGNGKNGNNYKQVS